MALDSHIRQLEQKHHELEQTLEKVMAHPSANDVEIADLKRQKLVIRDRLQRLRQGSAIGVNTH